MRTATRYLLFQVPGWLFAAVLLWLTVDAGMLGARVAVVLLVLLVVKDIALFRPLRHAYVPAAHPLVGRRAVASDRLAPRGWVRVEGALWRAELAPTDAVAEPGDLLTVTAVDGLRLRVARPVAPQPAGASPRPAAVERPARSA